MDKYNGYKNKLTWIIALWFCNDEILFRHWRAVYRTPMRKKGQERQMTKYELAEIMQNECEEEAENILNIQHYDVGWVHDTLLHAIHEVDFIEVAEAILDE